MNTAADPAPGRAPAGPDHPGQRGSAMLLIATLLVALLAGGGVALYLQLQGTKSAEMVKASRTSFYCAEAGLASARSIVALNFTTLPLVLAGVPANYPPWYPIVGDIDGDSVNDYTVTVVDNDDEVPPAANDPTRDVDGQVFAISRCTKNAEGSRQIVELLLIGGGTGHLYRNQSGGGAFNSGNKNQ
jgi:hypothetical protein